MESNVRAMILKRIDFDCDWLKSKSADVRCALRVMNLPLEAGSRQMVRLTRRATCGVSRDLAYAHEWRAKTLGFDMEVA